MSETEYKEEKLYASSGHEPVSLFSITLHVDKLRYCIVHNGEEYARELLAHHFNSDKINFYIKTAMSI
jgi:hypothetical protein